MNFYHFIEKGSDALGFLGPQVALGTLNTHNFTTTGYMESAFYPFMRF